MTMIDSSGSLLTRPRRPAGQRPVGQRPAGPRPADQDLLARVALALSSTLELNEVLRLLAELALEASGARHASFFLLKGNVLVPTVAIGARRDQRGWERFRAMDPITLDRVNLRLLAAGQAVGVPDAGRSSLVPPSWVEAFHLQAVVLVPLMAAGEPCGLMAMDWSDRRAFGAPELHLLGAMGAYAGIAIRNARLFDAMRQRAKLQEALARAAGDLCTPAGPAAVARRLVGAYTDLLGARLCVIALFDVERAQMSTIASWGTRRFVEPTPLSAIPSALKARVGRDWATSGRTIDLGEDETVSDFVEGWQVGAVRFLVLPLVVEGRPRGAVMLGLGRNARFGPDEQAAAEALAAVAAAALERADLLARQDRQLRQLDVLHRLNGALAEGADATALVARLNELMAGHGIEVIQVAFRDARLARQMGGPVATPEECAALRARSGGAVVEPRPPDVSPAGPPAEAGSAARPGSPTDAPDGSLAVPMRVGRRLVGTMRVRPADLGAEERLFLESLAGGLAEVVNRGALRRAMAEADQERAVAAERERLAVDLHDTAGQLFVALGLLARRQAEELPTGSPWTRRTLRLAELADRGKLEIDQAVRALTFVPARRRGLPAALRAMARSFHVDSGIDAEVRVDGRPYRLSPKVERALYRVTHEAFTNAWRHARCSVIRAHLAYSAGEVVLRVVDDGVGLGLRHPEEGVHVGIGGMRRVMTEVGGTVRVRNGRPRGVVVEARMSRDGR